ncbi:MAG TPA: FAD-dependent oxidoreductase [Candidatus Acidoferrales bacterium]|nr:FAD-dependent oxidoreductase [Candidatus Acidoferrales bacterium]
MIEVDELAEIPLFAGVTPALKALIASRSAEVFVATGEWVTREGDPAYLWIVLSGEVERVRLLNGRETQSTTFDPTEFFGEFAIVFGTDMFLQIRALRPTRMMRVDPADFHLLLSESETAAAFMSQTLIRRVTIFRDGYGTYGAREAVVIGSDRDPAAHAVRDFLSRNQVAFEWLDVDDPTEAEFIAKLGVDTSSFPVVHLADGRTLPNPTLQGVAEALGLPTLPRCAAYDILIVGGGPAGLAAAVYGGSEGLSTVLVERDAPGGQAGTSSRIENYLGFVSGISGGQLAHRALQQAKRLGAEVLVTRTVREVRPQGAEFSVLLDDGSDVRARSVVIATGVAWRKLATPGVEGCVGRGIFYGASRGEAYSVRGKDIFLIGGGNSAGQAAMFFSRYARRVTILVRGDGLERTMSQYLIEQLHSVANISVETHTTLEAAQGEGHLERIVTRSSVTGAEQERATQAVFIFIGADAETAWLPESLERDQHGYIRTGRDIEDWRLARKPYPLETSIPGIFAAGDVRSSSVKRVASSVGEGSIVVSYIYQYLEAAAQN